jgi:perosamine synthetase
MIPIYRPFLDSAELSNALSCIESTWISSKGPYINQFETQFAAKIDVEHATSVSNGTVALHLALLALGIGPGDEVIVPTFTYIASVNAIKYVGATPIFVDSNSDDWQLNPVEANLRVTSKTKAIMAVHLYGNPCDMLKILEIAKRNNLFVIEDCAEAIGTLINGRHVGTFGDVATFSFFGNKTITTGEGGMVVSRNPKIIRLVQRLKGQGLAEGREYWHDLVGYNYRMTNLCAAIGLAQLDKLDKILELKTSIAEFYFEEFANTSIRFQSINSSDRSSHWMCSILCASDEDRENVRRQLSNNQIETRPLFFPVHTMEMYKTGESLPVAEMLNRRGLNLPSFPGLNLDELKLIANIVKSAINS